MWYKELDYNKNLIEPILKMKSGMMRSDIKNIAETFNYSSSQGLKREFHHTYILGLRQLQEQEECPILRGHSGCSKKIIKK